MYGIYIQKNPVNGVLGWLKRDDSEQDFVFNTYLAAATYFISSRVIKECTQEGVEYVIKEYAPEIEQGECQVVSGPPDLHGKLQRRPDRRIGTRDRRAAQDRRQWFYMPF